MTSLRHVVPSASLAVLLATVPDAAVAQDESAVRVIVRDTLGVLIPFAYVQQRSGTSRVASDSGVAVFNATKSDSLRLIVRRIGYASFDGWARLDSTGAFPVALVQLPQRLAVVDVRERANTPLARTGFYDRLERSRRGAGSSRFFTPEELDLRNPPRISNILSGENLVKVNYSNGKVLLTGRARTCPMMVLLDGRKVIGLVEEAYTREGSEEIQAIMRTLRPTPDREARAIDIFLRARLSIDELVNSASVAAIEVYASVATVPAELAQNMTSDSCGLIALWTGARQ